MVYFLLVVSVMPRCNTVAAVLDAPTFAAALGQLAWAFADTLVAIVLETYLSLAMLIITFAASLGFCRGGGVGAMPQQPAEEGAGGAAGAAGAPAGAQGDCSRSTGAARKGGKVAGGSVRHAQPPLVRARKGGSLMQLAFALAHCLLHVTAAINLMLLLELGVEMCIR